MARLLVLRSIALLCALAPAPAVAATPTANYISGNGDTLVFSDGGHAVNCSRPLVHSALIETYVRGNGNTIIFANGVNCSRPLVHLALIETYVRGNGNTIVFPDCGCVESLPAAQDTPAHTDSQIAIHIEGNGNTIAYLHGSSVESLLAMLRCPSPGPLQTTKFLPVSTAATADTIEAATPWQAAKLSEAPTPHEAPTAC
ncbi:hypothetical protein KC356_g1404 [Hortaea werneckii]|nr:hypothetical protein KC356_g1404 [Hortaea werneckii]